jgi:hypothetical protein
MPFIAQKYLIRYIPEAFFEEYIIFKNFVSQVIVELCLFKVVEVI